MPNSLITYIYEYITKGLVFRRAVIGERLFRIEMLDETSYPKAFLYDLDQEQTRSFRLGGSGPKEDTGITRCPLLRSLTQLQKNLNLADKSSVVWMMKRIKSRRMKRRRRIS